MFNSFEDFGRDRSIAERIGEAEVVEFGVGITHELVLVLVFVDVAVVVKVFESLETTEAEFIIITIPLEFSVFGDDKLGSVRFGEGSP